jgi:hypothetical protein
MSPSTSLDTDVLLTFDDDVPVLAKGRALHGEGLRGPGAGLVDRDKCQIQDLN